jgi:integrase
VGVSRVYVRGQSLYVKVQSKRRGIAPHSVALGLEVGCEAEAEARRFAIERSVRMGEYKPPMQTISLDKFLTVYRGWFLNAAGPDRRARRERSWPRNMGSQLKIMVAWLKKRGCRTVRDVSRLKAEQYKDAMLTSGRELSSVITSVRIGAGAWTYAVKHEYAAENPWRGMDLGKPDQRDPRNLSALEIRQVFPIALAKSAEMHARMALGLYAGLRFDETCELRQGDLVWGDAGHIRFRDGNVLKDGSPRTTLFPFELQAILSPWRRDDAPEAPLLGQVVYERLRRFVARLAKGMTAAWTFHDLRKTFAGILNQQGVPTTYIRDYLGHASVSTTERYYVARNGAVQEHAKALTFGLKPAAQKTGAGTDPGTAIKLAASG